MVSRNESAIEVTHHEFNEVINNSHKLVVVDFFAEWCMPCLMIAPVIEELAEKMKDIKFLKINIDDNQELSEKYEIRSIPCLVIFKKGKEIDRIVGNRGGDVIEEKIKSLLKN